MPAIQRRRREHARHSHGSSLAAEMKARPIRDGHRSALAPEVVFLLSRMHGPFLVTCGIRLAV